MTTDASVVATATQTAEAPAPPDYSVLNTSSYTGFEEHMVKIYHSTITSATGSSIVFTNLIGAYLASVAGLPMGKKLDNLNLLDCSIGIRIVVQGQPFAAGKVVFAFTPNPKAVNDTVNFATHGPLLLNPVNGMVVPHVDIDPGASETYDLTLPNVSPTGVYGLKTETDMGSYAMTRLVISPLLSGTATSPSMTVCVYMWLIKPKLEGLTLLSLASKEGAGSGNLSYAVKTAGKYAGLVAPVFPPLTPAITLFSSVAGVVGDVLSFFGFRKSQVLDNTFFVQNRQVDNWSHVDGKSTAFVLGDSGFVHLSIDPGVGVGDGDEMSISKIVSIPGYVGSVSITPAMASGALLTEFCVSPTTSYQATNFYPTPMAGAAICFEYWAGDITFDFEVIASIFHRATLLVAFDSSYGLAAPTLESVVQTLPNVTIAVSGRSRTSVEIPWRKNALWAKVTQFEALDSTGSATQNGKIYVYLVNPLTSNGSTDPIKINIYAYSRNLSLEFPTTRLLSSCTAQVELLSTAVSFGTTRQNDKSLLSFGVRLNSMKELASKMGAYIGNDQMVTPATVAEFYGVRICPTVTFPTNILSVAADGSSMYPTFAGWIGMAYLTTRGGVRMSYYADSGEHMVMTGPKYASTSVGNGGTSGSNAGWANNTLPSPSIVNATTAVTAAAPTLDVVVPQIHPFKFRTNKVAVTGFPSNVHFSHKMVNILVDTVIRQRVLAGAADDVTFGFFVGWPPVAVV